MSTNKEKIKILDLETRPSKETDLLQLLSLDDLKGVCGGVGFVVIIVDDIAGI
ncbi:hypothetical protein [Moorena sp. SIO4G3]|uniref:hypothetical protein n=1 Tax=Moorena sp. SIO4G3 TaxID=2607821 RepID=UPI00142BB602|nr:hypothetical protein [Moorena sp. SIO4G3]NEO80699.1 hypothetical protein [Moorena sp. SIO4G3]